MTFLEDVLATKRRDIEILRRQPPIIATHPKSEFESALRQAGLSVIAEIKRRSPSKGPIAPELDAARTAHSYAAGGASAISCLTDQEFFGAQPGDLPLARTAGLPVLRKDFLIDELQIDESVALGASAILLIVRILDPARLVVLHRHARSRDLDVLVEVHDQAEIDHALSAGASIIGINNRDLSSLVVDHGLAARLRPRIPAGVISVAESGVKTREDVRRIEDAGFDAVLIGESLATSPDPAATLRELMARNEASR